jgi:putative transposase
VHFAESCCIVALGIGIDGSKALRKAVIDVLDRPVIQRCQLHKVRINRPSRPGSRRQVGRTVAA